MKNILILNGSPRINGKTNVLVKSFIEGALSNGNKIRNRDITRMNIKGCLACEACSRNGGHCIQKDDMEIINDDFLWADVIVLASPQYWATLSGQLKVVIDRLYALQNRIGMNEFGKKSSIFIMTSRGNYYDIALQFYSVFQMVGWKNLGTILGEDKIEEARKLGESL